MRGQILAPSRFVPLKILISCPPPSSPPFPRAQVFYHEIKFCRSLAECATLKATLAAARANDPGAVFRSPVVIALINPIDIMIGWDSKLLDGAFMWGGGLNYLRGNGGHDLVTAGMLCCSPLLGTGGKATFNTLVAGDAFLQKHGRTVYDAILTHVTRVWSLLDEL